jgi:hypothetical protein
MRGEVRDVFMSWLREARPDLVERYERLYARGAYAPKEERERLARLIPRSRPPGTRTSFRWRSREEREQERRRQERERLDRVRRRPEPAQESLF